jgi:hypothetical protein
LSLHHRKNPKAFKLGDFFLDCGILDRTSGVVDPTDYLCRYISGSQVLADTL